MSIQVLRAFFYCNFEYIYIIKWTSSSCISFLRMYFKWLPCHITLKCLVHERPFMNSISRVNIFSCSAFSTSSFSRISATLEYFYDKVIINIMLRALLSRALLSSFSQINKITLESSTSPLSSRYL